MIDHSFLFVLGACAFALMIHSHRRMLRAAQSLRLQLAKEGELLAAQEDLPELWKEQVVFLMDTAFSARFLLILGFFLIPIISFTEALRSPESLKQDDFLGLPEHYKDKFKKVFALHRRITFLNHPLLSALLDFEVSLFMLISTMVSGVLKQSPLPTGTPETLRDLVMVKEVKIRSLHYAS